METTTAELVRVEPTIALRSGRQFDRCRRAQEDATVNYEKLDRQIAKQHAEKCKK